MVTEMITVKLDNQFLEEVDKVVKSAGYHNRTEFIRNALREKLDEIKLKKAMVELAHLKGKSNKKISPEMYQAARNKAFEELENIK